jgi:ElaB/YqjD/DUF883 family membrane-anchored ribosome-binding protein
MQARQSDPASELKKDVEQLGKAMKAVAEDSADYVRENVKEYYQKGQEMVQGMNESLEGKIKKHPLRSLLIAAGIGFLFGALRK